jgi:hypothetical protein
VEEVTSSVDVRVLTLGDTGELGSLTLTALNAVFDKDTDLDSTFVQPVNTDEKAQDLP